MSAPILGKQVVMLNLIILKLTLNLPENIDQLINANFVEMNMDDAGVLRGDKRQYSLFLLHFHS